MIRRHARVSYLDSQTGFLTLRRQPARARPLLRRNSMSTTPPGREGKAISHGGSDPVPWQSRSLRNIRVGRKLGLTARPALPPALPGAAGGWRGLDTEDSRAQALAGLATSLQHGAQIRDAEGDMRVNVHVLAAARNSAQLRQ